MRLPFKRIVGIEVSAASTGREENLQNLHGLDIRCPDVRFVSADARSPYPAAIWSSSCSIRSMPTLRTLARIGERGGAGHTQLLYHTPEHLAVAMESGYPMLRVAEHAAVALAVDVEQDADRHEVGQDGRPTVGHER